jgi:hypothetical protein
MKCDKMEEKKIKKKFLTEINILLKEVDDLRLLILFKEDKIHKLEKELEDY